MTYPGPHGGKTGTGAQVYTPDSVLCLETILLC